MNNTLKDKLKGSPIYSIFQSPIARMHSMYNRMRNKRRFYLMKKQSLLVDPCTGKRQKYWIKCGVHINGNINIGYDVYFDASNAHLHQDVYYCAISVTCQSITEVMTLIKCHTLKPQFI